MDRDSLEKLRLDRRLIRRRGWVSNKELTRELEALPDSAESSTTLGDVSDVSESPPPRGGGETPPG